jgi:nicotinate-nucleotide adenylyltransferase
MLKQDFECLFGGTFDPVHLGHLAIIDVLQAAFPSTVVRIVPSAVPALKRQPDTTFQQRLEMLELAISGYNDCIIDDCEYLRQSKVAESAGHQQIYSSYTIDTLDYFKEISPNKTMLLVIGMDNLANFKHWHQWQSFADNCHLVVINRSGITLANEKTLIKSIGFELCDKPNELFNEKKGMGIFLKMPDMPQSSTEIRKSLKNSSEIDSMLPKSVIEYIQAHKLYLSK